MPANTDMLTLRAIQTDNARLRGENQSQKEEISGLRQALRALRKIQDSLAEISPDSNVHTLLKGVLAAALEAVGSVDGSLQLMDEETGELVFVQVQGELRNTLAGYRLPAGAGISGWAATHRTAELSPDVRLDARFYPEIDQQFGFRTMAVIVAPLVDGERVMGVIEAVNKRNGEPFNQQDLDVILLVSHLAAAALKKAEGPRP